MKHTVSAVLASAALLASVGVQAAGDRDVAVFGDRFNIDIINNFYNSLANTTSTEISGLTDANLAGVELLWAVQPAAAYSDSEIAALKKFMNGGGRIAFMGEHGGYAPAENARITTAIGQLGGSISINTDAPDGGYHDATRTGGPGEGLIKANSLTEGVNIYNYACFASLNLSGNAEALMYGIDHSLVMMGYQVVGTGSIFLITDQNVWDNVYASSNDNKRMFENLLSAYVPGTPVPEPSTYALMLLGMGAMAVMMRRRNRDNG